MTNGRFKAQDTPHSINKAISRANDNPPRHAGERQDIVIYDSNHKGAIMSRGSYYAPDKGYITWGRWEEY